MVWVHVIVVSQITISAVYVHVHVNAENVILKVVYMLQNYPVSLLLYNALHINFVGGDYTSSGSTKVRDITVPSPASLNRIVSSPGSMSLPQYAGYVCVFVFQPP